MTIDSQELYFFLENFRMKADDTLNTLYQASMIERADTESSNWTPWGWFVSKSSLSKNFEAAAKLDELGVLAHQVNEFVLGRLQSYPGARLLGLLPSFNGNSIREAEANEHSIFQWLSDGSTMASALTQSQIQYMIGKVEEVRNHAWRMIQILPSVFSSTPYVQLLPPQMPMPMQQPMQQPTMVR